ncbi:MAG: histidine kinase [Flavobacteriales bacterium]|nr:histidine kinase [Flavobacteriales bacterium]MCB9363627.1 histidine kinase [Flavobacteriales bacterium]
MRIERNRCVFLSFFLISVLFFFTQSLFSQSTAFLSEKSITPTLPYSVQIWNTENGLPQNSINSITQTKDGYLWLATFDGLVRFDGVNFTIFNSANTSLFNSNYIHKVFGDNSGRLWVVTSNEILLYNKSKFQLIDIKPYQREVSFTQSKSGDVFICTEDQGLFRFYNNQLQFLEALENLKAKAIECINDKLYIATNNGIYTFDKKLQLLIKTQNGVTNLMKGLNDEDLLFIEKGNVNQIKNGERIDVDFLKKFPKNLKVDDILVNDTSLIILKTREKILILKNDKLSIYDENNGLTENNLLRVFCDSEKNIWVGTFKSGINMLKEKVFQSFTEKEGFTDNSATAIVQSLDSSMWIGYQQDGLYKLTKKQNEIEKISLTDNNEIRSLMRDKKGTIWVGTGGRGLFKYNSSSHQFNIVSDSSLYGKSIHSLLEDSEGRIWIGTNNELFTYKNDKITPYKTDEIKVDNINFMMEDSKGRILYGSHLGLGIISKENHYRITTKEGLSNNKVRSIYEDDLGILWIGTYGGGLNRIKNDTIFAFENQSGMLNENVSCILEDDYGFFWMTSNNGLYRVEKQSLNDYADKKSKVINSSVFVREDGIHNIEFNGGSQPSAYEDFNGDFWFPSISGIVKANTSYNYRTNSNVVIEKLLVNGKEVDFENQPEISTRADEIEIFYTQPSFYSPKNIRFQYKIEGLHSDWINANTRRVAYFSNLPGGEYEFKVRTYSNPNNVVGFSFFVPTPFWKTWQFLLVIIVLIVLLLSFLMFLRITSIKKKAIAKTKENKKYAEMELAALRAQMNPHFIFNCLNTIKYFVATNDDSSANKYLNNFSKLMRMFLEHSKSNTITLQEEIDLLSIYIELENLRFNDNFDFKLVIHDDVNTNDIEIPSMLFQPFVENAITHGLLNLSRKGALTIELYIKNNTLVGIIEDDGIGRAKAREIKNKRAVPHISRGLEITNERIQVINAVKNMNIYIETIDKFDENDVASGTKVILYIPIKN